MLSSSPRALGAEQRASEAGPGASLQAPSSPTLAYHDGEISPSFDASFASSMCVSVGHCTGSALPADRGASVCRSISSGERQQPTPLPAHLRTRSVSHQQSSPVVAMDISPAPQPVAGPSGSSTLRAMRAPPPPRPPLFARPHSQPVTLEASPSVDKATHGSGGNGSEHPFLKSLFKAQKSAPPEQTTFAPIGPLSVSRPASPDALGSTAQTLRAPSGGRPVLQHYATVPPTQAEKLRPPFAKSALEYRARGEAVDVKSLDERSPAGAQSMLSRPSSSSGRSRGSLPGKAQRQTAPAGLLAPPLLAPAKRKSDPVLPTSRRLELESSPYRMEVDGESPRPRLHSPIALRPGSQLRSVSDCGPSPSRAPVLLAGDPESSPSSDADQSGASDRLADMFGGSPGDNLSPIPQSRKRVLDQENSPTPACASPTASILGTLGGPTRRPFEKSATTASLPLRVRRQRSAVGLNVRPPPPGCDSPSLPATAGGETFSIFNNAKRQATQAQDGKPAPVPPMLRASRRSNSVADPNFLSGSTSGSSASMHSGESVPMALGTRDLNVPIESPRRPLGPRSSLTTVGSNYLCGGSAAQVTAVGLSPEAGSPIAGFRKQEAKGKALPCHGVQEDGLMRITPQTVSSSSFWQSSPREASLTVFAPASPVAAPRAPGRHVPRRDQRVPHHRLSLRLRVRRRPHPGRDQPVGTGRHRGPVAERPDAAGTEHERQPCPGRQDGLDLSLRVQCEACADQVSSAWAI